MRRFLSATLGAVVLTGLWSSQASAQVSVDVPVRVDAQVETQIAPKAEPIVVQREEWRYKQHNGTWWYWMPENYWMVYRNNAWTRFETAPAVTVPTPAVTTPAPVVTTPAPVVVRPSPVVTPPLRFTPLRPGVGAVVRPRYRW